MEHFIHQVTENLASRLPDETASYRPETLKELGIPSFVVERIEVELYRNLAESILPPKTDWADMESDRVTQAWSRFIEAIEAEAQLPAPFAQSVMETAIADILEALTEPRRAIPEILFGTDTEITPEQLSERMASVTVYRHLVAALPRYMEKKELDLLTRERCQLVITQIDEKVTANYTPLNWAHLLEPYFQLFEGNVDSDLFRRFFEHRQMTGIAARFDEQPGDVARQDLIEIISAPELESEMELGNEPEHVSKTEPEVEPEHADEDLSASDVGVPVSEPTDDASANEAEPQPESVTDFEPLSEMDEEIESSATREESPAEEYTEEEEGYSLLERYRQDQDEGGEEAGEGLTVEPAAEPEVEPADASDSNEAEEVPMWQRYMSDSEEEPEEAEMEDEDQQHSEEEDRDYIDSYFEEESDESKRDADEPDAGPTLDEEGFIDEPIIDLTEEDEGTDRERERRALMAFLSDDKSYFVEEIFGGDEMAYMNALEDLTNFSQWRSASKYISSEIFRRNFIDIYSEPAVDFTDRLQTYFLQKNNED